MIPLAPSPEMDMRFRRVRQGDECPVFMYPGRRASVFPAPEPVSAFPRAASPFNARQSYHGRALTPFSLWSGGECYNISFSHESARAIPDRQIDRKSVV